jgi:tetratricopeptide (TPR) repeat protein
MGNGHRIRLLPVFRISGKISDISFFEKICIMERVKNEPMQDAMRRKIVISLAVLAVFGFFYFCRERMVSEYADRARLKEQNGNEAAALSDLVMAAALEEKNGKGDAAVKRARIFFASGNFRAAEKELLEALENGGNSAELYSLLGKIKKAEGEYDKAEEYYVLATAKKEDAAVILERAKNLARSGKFFEAESVLSSAAARFSDEDISYYLGLVRAHAGRFSAEEFAPLRGGKHEDDIVSAIGFFAKKNSASPADDVLVARADLFCRIGAEDLALADLDVVLERRDKYRDAYLVQGKAYLVQGDYAAAQKAFEKALALDSKNSQALFYLGRIYQAAGDEEKADEFIKRYKSLAESFA